MPRQCLPSPAWETSPSFGLFDPMTQAAKKTQDTDRKFLENLKNFESTPRAQVIIAYDGVSLIVEAPGLNGAAREKIEGISLTDLPGEIQAVLIERLTRRKAEVRAAVKIQNRDTEADRRENNAAIAKARAEADRRYLDSLSNEARGYEESKREKKRLAIAEAEKARARDLWRTTAKHHSIDLADRVIDDPSRRPNQRVVINHGGVKVTYNPRFDSEPKTEKQKRAKKSTLSNVKLNLDLGI